MHKEAGTYVYIAKDRGGARSYVGVTASLLGMAWIPLYGVDHLVWFDSWPFEAAAVHEAERLRAMSEEDRSALIREHNPLEADLYHRIQCSDPYDDVAT